MSPPCRDSPWGASLLRMPLKKAYESLALSPLISTLLKSDSWTQSQQWLLCDTRDRKQVQHAKIRQAVTLYMSSPADPTLVVWCPYALYVSIHSLLQLLVYTFYTIMWMRVFCTDWSPYFRLRTVRLEKCLGSKGKQHYKCTASETQTHNQWSYQMKRKTMECLPSYSHQA